MKRIPGAREVDRAFKELLRTSKESFKKLNQTAAQAMAKGDYATVEALAQKGREITTFRSEIEAFRARWKQIDRGASPRTNEPRTPLWEYYQPILKALVELGGEATREQVESSVERIMKPDFKPGDTGPLSRGKQRWQAMVRRARKSLITEGWLEPDGGKLWRITAAGRKAASARIAPRRV